GIESWIAPIARTCGLLVLVGHAWRHRGWVAPGVVGVDGDDQSVEQGEAAEKDCEKGRHEAPPVGVVDAAFLPRAIRHVLPFLESKVNEGRRWPAADLENTEARQHCERSGDRRIENRTPLDDLIGRRNQR